VNIPLPQAFNLPEIYDELAPPPPPPPPPPSLLDFCAAHEKKDNFPGSDDDPTDGPGASPAVANKAERDNRARESVEMVKQYRMCGKINTDACKNELTVLVEILRHSTHLPEDEDEEEAAPEVDLDPVVVRDSFGLLEHVLELRGSPSLEERRGIVD
jgi:hypothetical protein